MSDSVQPHPWDSPGKNIGVGCHFLLQCIKVKSESEVAQSCLTLRDRMNCSLPGTSIHGIFQARVLGKNTGVGCHFLLQGIFPTQGSNPQLLHFLHWQVGSLPLSHLQSPCSSCRFYLFIYLFLIYMYMELLLYTST